MRINPHISIDKDTGTKIRFKEYDAVYPENIDVKITNRCDQNCPFCHENSTPDGLSFQVKDALKLFRPLPYPTEIAFGGGDPSNCVFEINKLVQNLPNCICNVTLNLNHIYFTRNIRANAFGISIPKNVRHMPDFFENIMNYVIHLIAGVNSFEDIEHYVLNHPRVLILGYKSIGRGANHWPENELKTWKIRIGQIFNLIEVYKLKNTVLAFDNLALEQLDIKRFFSKEKYDNLYMGADGVYSFYIDLVKMTYAKSSIDKQFEIGDKNIKQMFKHVKTL